MHQQGFDGIASGGILAFRIDENLDRHLKVRFLVDVEVANAFGMPQDRNFGIVHDLRDQLSRSSRDNQIDVLIERKQLVYFLTVFDPLKRVYKCLICVA